VGGKVSAKTVCPPQGGEGQRRRETLYLSGGKSTKEYVGNDAWRREGWDERLFN